MNRTIDRAAPCTAGVPRVPSSDIPGHAFNVSGQEREISGRLWGVLRSKILPRLTPARIIAPKTPIGIHYDASTRASKSTKRTHRECSRTASAILVVVVVVLTLSSLIAHAQDAPPPPKLTLAIPQLSEA